MSPRRTTTLAIHTASLALQPSHGALTALTDYAGTFAKARRWLWAELPAAGTHNQARLQKLFYAPLRDRFGLPAQAAVLCLRQVAKADVAGDGGAPAPGLPIPYDQRLMGLKGIDLVSLMTLDGRVEVPFLVADYDAPEPLVGEAELLLEPAPVLHLRLAHALARPDRAEDGADPVARLAALLGASPLGRLLERGGRVAGGFSTAVRAALDGLPDSRPETRLVEDLARLAADLELASGRLAALRLRTTAAGRPVPQRILDAETAAMSFARQLSQLQQAVEMLAKAGLVARIRAFLAGLEDLDPTL